MPASAACWSWGVGAGYAHRRYDRPDDRPSPARRTEDESFGVYGSLGRQLSRDVGRRPQRLCQLVSTATRSDLEHGRSAPAATLSYDRTFLMDRLQLLAALGLYNTDNGTIDSTVSVSALLGLRYTF